MKICPVCSARCFDDMETCFGCMHRFDAPPQGPVELSLPQEITLQDISASLRRPQPRHAAVPTPDRGGAPSQITVDLGSVKPGQEGFQAEYQLVISLKPTARDAAMQAGGLQGAHVCPNGPV